MRTGVLSISTRLHDLPFGWGWPLASGAVFGLLIYLLILPFPHRPAAINLGADGCELLREAGFSVKPRSSGCLLRGAYREGTTPGFVSIRQGEVEIQIRLSEITTIQREDH